MGSDGERGTLDWQEIRRRIGQATPGRKAESADPDTTAAILRERARELARVTDVEEEEVSLQVVEFIIGGERYALETAPVREVLPLREVTPIPCTPAFILGVLNVRGKLLPVTELKRLFPLSEEGVPTAVIVLAAGAMEIGIAADEIIGVRMLPVSALQAGVPLPGIDPGWVKGVTGARTAILDAEAILGDPRLVVHEEAG